MIATFPSRHYDIEDYPTVRDYLLSFGKERLEQTGKTYTIDGVTFKSRKKTANKWFEMQDSIAYWKDFDRPKIVWGEISDRSKFAYEYKGGFIPEATTFLLVGRDLPYLLCILNAPLSEWFFSKIGTTTGVGTVRWKKYTIQELLIPTISEAQKTQFTRLVDSFIHQEISFDQLSKQANQLLYDAVHLTGEEIRYIEGFYSPTL